MRYRKLGSTGLTVSEIGFGTIPVLKGSVPVLPDYYNLSDAEALAVMEHARSLGCNLYDTAIVPEYGDAELKLGKFAASLTGEKSSSPTRQDFMTAMTCTGQWRPPAKIWEPGLTSILSTKWILTARTRSLGEAAPWTL